VEILGEFGKNTDIPGAEAKKEEAKGMRMACEAKA